MPAATVPLKVPCCEASHVCDYHRLWTAVLYTEILLVSFGLRVLCALVEGVVCPLQARVGDRWCQVLPVTLHHKEHDAAAAAVFRAADTAQDFPWF